MKTITTIALLFLGMMIIGGCNSEKEVKQDKPVVQETNVAPAEPSPENPPLNQ